MNKVFKVIWNHATQTWTAVSELGHAKGKTKSKKIVKLTALAGAVIGVMGTAQAAVDTAKSTITIKSDAPTNVANTNEGERNINIGTGANTYRLENGKVSHDAIAIGSNAAGTGDASIAIGLNATAPKQNGIAIGNAAKNDSQSSVAIGDAATSSKDMDVAIGRNAAASGGESLALASDSKASGQAALAIGRQANSTGSSAVSLGNEAQAIAASTVAIGKTSSATSNNAVAVGVQAKTTGRNGVGVGAYADATAGRSTAIGPLAQANGEGSFAGGASARATGTNSIAIGGATDGDLPGDKTGEELAKAKAGTAAKAVGNNAIALGTKSNAVADNSIAQGANATANKESDIAIGTNSVANGTEGVCNKGEKGSSTLPPSGSASNCEGSAIALGKSASATGTNAVAVGVGASSIKNATALGSNANASIENAVALGSNSTTNAFVPTSSATVGSYTYGGFAGATSGLGNGAVVSVGSVGNERQIQNVAAGRISSTSTDAVNGSQLFAVANRVENLNPFTFQGFNGSTSNNAAGTYTYAPQSVSNTLKLIAGDGLTMTSNGSNEYTLSVIGGGATGPAGATGATGPKGDKGDTGATGANGTSAEGTVTRDETAGTSTIVIKNTDKDGNVTSTTATVKDGKDGATGATGANGTSARADVKDNGDGTHTVTVVNIDKDGNIASTTTTTIRDGKDGKAIGKFGLVDETGTTDGTIEKDLNKTIQIKGDAGTKVKVYDKQTGKAVEKEVQNIFVKKDGDALKVSLNPDVTVNSVTTNELKAGPVTINNNGIDAGNKQIKNVADGKDDTDAVNVRQLRNNISNVNNRINKVGKEARGGIAGANAAAGLPQVYIPGKSMVAASAGTFKGESAVAVGYSRSSDNGKVIFKLQGNANTQGDVGGSVGVGYQW